jgi:shikimate dehydrogenase
MDRYCVIGNPIEHSLSPQIHRSFATQTGQSLTYEKVEVEIGGFSSFLKEFIQAGGKGLNITLPFKIDAFEHSLERHPLANTANAVNTIVVKDQNIVGYNTDGVGFVRDLTQRHRFKVQGKSVLILGAGGACRGIIDPLLAANPRSITIANRTLSNAHALCSLFKHNPKYDRLFALRLDDLADRSPRPIDLVVNTTSLGLSSGEIGFSTKIVKSSFCYDMSYGENAVFARWALAHGAQQSVDGLGMLVEQAAESFCLWRGVLPATDKIYEALEKQVRGQL